jgi:hypothetical protein
MVLSVIAGLFIFLGGIALLFVGAILAALLAFLPVPLGVDPVGTINLLGTLGIVFGLVDVALGVMMFVKPALTKVFGAIVLVVSLLSILALGGFFVGMILGLVGGILGIIFKPEPVMAAYPAPAAPPMQ